MSAQNKRKGSKKRTKYGMDRDDLQQYKEELESDSSKEFEDEFIDAEECKEAPAETATLAPISKKRKVLRYVVAAVSATAMIVGGIAAGLILGSAITKNKEDKSNG